MINSYVIVQQTAQPWPPSGPNLPPKFPTIPRARYMVQVCINVTQVSKSTLKARSIYFIFIQKRFLGLLLIN